MERMSKLETLAQVVLGLNNVMHDCLVEFLKQHNGLVRTDSYEHENGSLKDSIYCIYQDMMGEQRDARVLAVVLQDNGQVAVLPDYGDETIKGVSDDDIRNSIELMEIMGGEVLQNATLYDLCAYIEEYV